MPRPAFRLLPALALALVLPLAALADTAATVLRDGFEGADFAPEGGLYYRLNDEQAAGTVEFQGDQVRNGKGALRLSVRAMCAADAEGCSERAEIWEKTPLRVPYETGVWFAFAVRFAEPVPQDDHRYLIAQWKREIGPEAKGDFSPYLAFRMTNGKLFLTAETNYFDPAVPPGPPGIATCPAGQTPVWLRPETNQLRLFLVGQEDFGAADDDRFTACTDRVTVTRRGGALPDPRSGWIDFAVYSRPGPDGDGRLEVFANGAWVISVAGHIGHGDHGLGENQYFKFGPYRDGATDPWTLYYDDFVRSPACTDVLPAATCTAAGF
jgi:hypothetical protein